VTIDTTDGSATNVNKFSGGSPVIQTIAFAPDGTLYGSGSRLYNINPSSGTFAQVGTGSLDEICGMVYLVPEPSMIGLAAAALLGLTATARRNRSVIRPLAYVTRV
jgi:hypothetical protein